MTDDEKRAREIEESSEVLEQIASLTDEEIAIAAKREGITIEKMKDEIASETWRRIGQIKGIKTA